MPDETQEQDVFARVGLTDADFEDEPQIGDVPEEASDDRPRDEHGRFVAKDKGEEPVAPEEAGASSTTGAQEPEAVPDAAPPAPAAEEAPARFSAEAKAAWASAPPALRSEVLRAQSELQSGLEQYQAKLAPLKNYIDMAGGPEALAEAAQRYVGIEQMLAADPIKGLSVICNNLGTDLRSVAAHVMGQPAPDGSQEMGQLRQQLAQAQAELQQFRQEKTQTLTQTVQQFADQHPRFDELSREISWALKTGLASTLPEAYEYAERLKPAPQAAPAAAPEGTTQQPQTPPANLSVDGGPGSNPGYQPPKDRRQNIADRLAEFGL